MKTQNDIDQLLDAAKRHHDDDRRQQRLADLVDQWAAAEEETPRQVPVVPLTPSPRRSPRVVWGRIAAAVALLVAAGVMLPLLLPEKGVRTASNGMPPAAQVPSAPRDESHGGQAVAPAPVEKGRQSLSESRQNMARRLPAASIEPLGPLVAAASAEEPPVEAVEATVPPVEPALLAETHPQEPTAPKVIEITSTRLVCFSESCRQPAREERPSAESLATLLKPLSSTEMHVNVYTFKL